MVRLLVLDEISMLSGVQLEMISRRLDQVQKSRQRRLSQKTSAPTDGFGGISLLFVGDFGQLPPVNGLPLISNRVSRKGSGLHRSRTLARAPFLLKCCSAWKTVRHIRPSPSHRLLGYRIGITVIGDYTGNLCLLIRVYVGVDL